MRLILQNPYSSFICRTVKEDLLSPNSPMEIVRSHELEFSNTFWEKIKENWGNLNRSSFTFSFGQLKFLQLMLIPTTVEVAIFDEPLLGLDPCLHSTMLAALTAIAESGRIVIAATEIGTVMHHQDLVFSISGNSP